MWELWVLHYVALTSSAELRLVGYRSRLGKRPGTPLPWDVKQPGSAAHIGLTFHCLLAFVAPSPCITARQLNSESESHVTKRARKALMLLVAQGLYYKQIPSHNLQLSTVLAAIFKLLKRPD